jgi:hypothetical protein
MKKEDILLAYEEAQRFIKAVDDYRNVNFGCWEYKHSANVKRKSMDLTRSLSKMRNGDKYD